MRKRFESLWVCFLSISVSILAIGTSVADSQTPAETPGYTFSDSEFEAGLLWRLSRDGIAQGYLYGTMHSGDPRVLRALAPLEPYLDDVDAVCPELELSMQDSMLLTQRMVFPDETTLADVIGEALFEEVAPMLSAAGVPRFFSVRLKPWAVVMMLSMPANQSPEVLDLALIEQGRTRSLRIHPLETVEEQIAVFEDTSVEDQIALLKDAIDQYPEIDSYFEQMIEGYLNQDLLIADALMQQQTSHDTQAVDRTMKRLVDDRNRKMATRIDIILEESRCFIAVGMLHLPGSAGLLSLLQDQGLTVERVTEFDF